MTTILAAPLALLIAATPARADEVVEEAVKLILRHHLLHPDPASLARESPAALLASLRRIDPAAQWWPPDTASANREWTGADVVGIGASVIDDGSRILLVPQPGGALARHGVSRPVRLTALRGRPVDRLDLEKVQQILGDPVNDPVEVSAEDLVGGPPIDLVLERSSYDPVSAERIDAYGLPILRIHRFIKGVTLPQLRVALQPILATGQPIVLDLRYSTGGDLFEALDSASLFLPPGLKLATLEDATGRRTVFQSVDKRVDGDDAARKIFVLVGQGTISAAETFAAALQHYAHARLIGMPTFGKCLAQSAFPLIDGSVIVLSTGRILNASDWYCAGKGLAPDIRVDRAEADDTDALIARYVR
jgi:carboxyl-terminal processing protease